jgi:hypothetical protein
VEVGFQMRGLPFRLVGVIENVRDRNTIDIRFLEVSYRKRVELAELIEELREAAKMPSGDPENELTQSGTATTETAVRASEAA